MAKKVSKGFAVFAALFAFTIFSADMAQAKNKLTFWNPGVGQWCDVTVSYERANSEKRRISAGGSETLESKNTATKISGSCGYFATTSNSICPKTQGINQNGRYKISVNPTSEFLCFELIEY